MRKYINKIFVVTALSLTLFAVAGVETAMGADFPDNKTVGSVEYKIAFKNGGNVCWYNPQKYPNETEKNEVEIQLTLEAKANVKATQDKITISISNTLKIKDFPNDDENFPCESEPNNDSVCSVTFAKGEIDTKSGATIKILAKLQQESVSKGCTVWAVIQSGTGGSYTYDTIKADIPLKNMREASRPKITSSLLIGRDSIYDKDKNVSIIVVKDNVKYGKYYFWSDTGAIINKDTIIGVVADTIGWKKAEIGGNYKHKPPTLPKAEEKFFKAHDDSLSYKYDYKYTESTCELDTTLSVGVWVKKLYKPEITKIDSAVAVDSLDNPLSCQKTYRIWRLPYIVDIAESGKQIDTVQIGQITRVIKGEKSSVENSKEVTNYSSTWVNTIMDTVQLGAGGKYTIKYEYRYKYAPTDSVAVDSVVIAVPFPMKTVADSVVAYTNSKTLIRVMANDSLSKCHPNKIIVDSVYERKVGNKSFRGGTLKIVGDSVVEYTSAPNFQGLDTFIYRLKDTSAYGIQQKSYRTGVVVVRVDPLYELTVSKAVDSVINRKFHRTANGKDPNLDSMFVGDTAYFTIKVRNTGKNAITKEITVRDTLPAGFDTISATITPSATTVTETTSGRKFFEWKVTGSDAKKDTLGVDSVRTFRYALVAVDTAITPPDTNKVHVFVTLRKNTFETFDDAYCPNGCTDADTLTTVESRDTLLLKVYESIDVGFTTGIDTSFHGDSWNFNKMGGLVDSLRCDSLYQPVQLVMTVTNRGSTVLNNVWITDTITKGLGQNDSCFYQIMGGDGVASQTCFIIDGIGTAGNGCFDVELSKKQESGTNDSVYLFNFKDISLDPNHSIRLFFRTHVDTIGTFYSRAWAYEEGKMDIDSTDNYDPNPDTVVFEPQIKLDVKKSWTKYPDATEKYIGVNSILEFAVEVANESNLPLRDVVVRDTLWTPYLVKADKPDANKTNPALTWKGDSTIEWKIPYLGSGAKYTLLFYVEAKDTTDNHNNRGPTYPDSVNNVAHAYLPLYYGYGNAYRSGGSPYIHIQSGRDLALAASILPPLKAANGGTFSQRQSDTVKLMLKITNMSQQEDVDQSITVKVDFRGDSLNYVKYETTSSSTYDASSKQWIIPSSANKLNKGQSDSITITLTAKANMGLTRVGGYVNNSPYGGIVSNDTSYAALRIVENPVDLRVTKRVPKSVLLEGEIEISDTIAIYTGKSGIQNITLVDSLPLNVSGVEIGEVSKPTLSSSFDTARDNNNRYIVFTKSRFSLDANDSVVVVVKYKVSKDGDYPSVAYVYCDSVEVTKDNNVVRGTTSVLPLVNLKAELTAKAKHPALVYYPNQAMEGDTIIYRLVVSHDDNSNSDAKLVTTLTFEPVPNSVVFLSAACGGDTLYGPNNGNSTVFNIRGIPRTDSAIVEVQVRVKPRASYSSPPTIRWSAYSYNASDAWSYNDYSTVEVTPIANRKDISVSITPADTFFYLSLKDTTYTHPFNDTIRVKNIGTDNVDRITVVYSNPKYEQEGFSPIPEKNGDKWVWTVSSLKAGEDTVLAVFKCRVPYVRERYKRSVTVSAAGTLEADPTNNHATATVGVIYDLDFKIDSVQLLGRNGVPLSAGSISYTQGDTVTVRVKLTNEHGSKAGDSVTVALVNTVGFTAVDSFTHKLKRKLARGGALYDTLKLVVDTFTVSGSTLNLRIAARADTTQGVSRRIVPVRDSAWSAPFTVHKGADAYVGLHSVAHKRPYYKNLLYGIAVGNRGQYKATGVQLHHIAASDTVRLDSVRIYNPHDGVDTTLMPPPNGAEWDSVWNLGTISSKEIAGVALYVVVTKENLDAKKSMSVPVTGYTTCINDSSPQNDTIKNAVNYKSALEVTRNPYHLKVTKTSGQPPSISSDNLANSAKAASQTPYSRIDDPVAYTITVQNVGDSAAYKLKIVDTIPTNTIKEWGSLSYKTDTASFDTVRNLLDEPVAYFIAWNVDTLQPGASKNLTFSALVHEAGAVVNTAKLVDVDSTQQHPFDPDPENKKDHTSVDTTKVRSAQSVSDSAHTYSYQGIGNPANTFTQGDTLALVITVEKKIANEKALGIKIKLDTSDLNGRLKFLGVRAGGNNTLNSTFKDTTWRLDLDANKDAWGELTLYAVVASNLLSSSRPLDSVVLGIIVEDTSEYYPEIRAKDSVKIYREYRDLDLAVKVEASVKETYPGEPFNYTITIQNKGEETLLPDDSITLIAVLPSNISGIPFDMEELKNSENFTQKPDTVYYIRNDISLVALRWNNLRDILGDIKNGKEISITLQNCSGNTVNRYFCYAELLVNRSEADGSNNSSWDTVNVINPLKFRMKFELDTSSGKDTVAQGDTRTLRFTVFNNSDRPVTGLSIQTERIPPQLRFIDDEGCDYDIENQIISWNSPEVPPNDSVTVTFVVQATGLTGEAKLVANLYYEYEKVTDPDTVKLYVKRDPYDVSLTKTAYKAGTTDSPVFYEDEKAPYLVDYKISIKASSEYLTNVVVTDTLPAGVDTAPGFAATPGFATPPYTTKVTVTKTNDKRIVIVYTNTELLKGETVDIIFPCKVDSSSPKSYINRAYITYTEAEYEKNSENNTDTALVEVRGLINLKMDMALCRRDQDPTEYPRGYKFRQGDVVYLKVSVLNNGRETSTGNTPTALTINPSDGNLGSFSSDSLRFLGRLENVQYFPVNTDKCGKFSISADATINYTKPGAKEPTLYRDSAKVANIIILPSADVRVNIEVDPPGYDYNIHRAYTIKLKNIGRFRADTVMLTHKLDANIVSLDSVDVTTLNGFSLRLRKGLWQGKDLDSLVSKGPTRERLTYSRFDSTLTYTLDAVGSYWGEASVRLFVTTVEPSWDTVVKILPDAEAYVYQNWDNNLHNNKGYGSWIRVHPNPYNVSISIASEEEREDLRNVAGADVQMTFTITAKNIGRLPAMGTIFYDVSSGLVISNVDNAPVEAEEVKADSLSYEWKISPQLGAKDSLTFKVTVAPENASSKGQKLNIVRIEPVFSDNPDDKDADMSNNADTAYLNLFSVLDSWPLMEAFSPNGDGKNDRFFIPDLESGLVKEAKIVILNRYGSEVYYNSDYKAAQQSESAAFTGAGLPEGSYFYQLTVHFSDGSVSKRGGIITLRRSRWR